MDLRKSIGIGELKKKNAESQAARTEEKRGSTPADQQQKGRWPHA
ncbi:hypothetical protein [Streptomyces violaceoruber]|nr:hypothetical protein [Streptomyces violaceoruber]